MIDFLKKFKGPFFKKNGFLDYTEVHKWMYGAGKGFTIFRPSKIASNMNALHMDFEQWENSEGQYSDYGMITAYSTKMSVTVGLLVEHFTVEQVIQWSTLIL